jgi:hypothetical protein
MRQFQKSSQRRELSGFMSVASFRVSMSLKRHWGVFYMTLSTRIAPHLPYLRRFSRAVTGSQTSGDAYVAATLEALIADISLFPEASTDRIALYKLFSALFSSSAVSVPEPVSTFAWEQRAASNLANLPARPRQAFRKRPVWAAFRRVTAAV